VSVSDVPSRAVHWFAALPTYKQGLLLLATTVFLVELLLRRVAKGTVLYARWTAFFEGLGAFWSAVILSIVYFVSVALIWAFMKLSGKDLLDRKLTPEPSFWRAHEPNPLGPLVAARHQF
jgi:thiol:disulfide interchange protein